MSRGGTTRVTSCIEKAFATLYAPLYMPAPLLKAHQNLDRAVDRCYRKEKFETERERVEFLFGLYETMTRRD